MMDAAYCFVLSVILSLGHIWWAMQKMVNWSRCHLGCGLMGQTTSVLDEDLDPERDQREGHFLRGGWICPKVHILSESQEGSMRQCGLLTTITVATCLTQLCTVVVASVTLVVHSMKASSRSAQSVATKCFTGYALLSTGSGQRILTEGQLHPHTCHPRGGWVHSEAAHWPLCTVPSPLLLLCLLLTQSNAFQWGGEQSPPWGGIWAATWYMIPWAHPSPQPQQHLDRFSHICRAHCCIQQTNRPTLHL